MKRNLLLFLILMQSLFNSVLHAQSKPDIKVGHGGIERASQTARTFGFTDERGTWEFEVYPGDIIKTVFKPNNYSTNELVSNAVIAKPIAQQMTYAKVREGAAMLLGKRISVKRTEGLIWYYLDGKLMSILQEPIDKDGYHGFALRLQDEEKIFGGGERALPLDRRGYRFNLYNNPW